MTKARDIADSDLEDLVVQNDIEVSGGIYLGGTGSANKLDDYEEGTWTPVLDASTTSPSVTYISFTAGSYTKIGKEVNAKCFLIFSACSGGSGDINITGLPFVHNSNLAAAIGVVGLRRVDYTNDRLHVAACPEGANFVFIKAYPPNTEVERLDITSVQGGTFGKYIEFDIKYFTNS